MWIDAAPNLDEQAQSVFVEVPGLRMPDIGHAGSAKLSYGWVDLPGEDLRPDNFLSVPEWLGRQTPIDHQPDAVLIDKFSQFAKILAEWSRNHTFKTFKQSVLGIALEFGSAIWQSPDHTDPNDYDSIPHLDHVNPSTPSLLVLSATGAPSALFEGSYTYNGNSSQQPSAQHDDEDHFRYAEVAYALTKLPVQPGNVYCSDARRGLHARPVMTPGYETFTRHFVRAFVAPMPGPTEAHPPERP